MRWKGGRLLFTNFFTFSGESWQEMASSYISLGMIPVWRRMIQLLNSVASSSDFKTDIRFSFNEKSPRFISWIKRSTSARSPDVLNIPSISSPPDCMIRKHKMGKIIGSGGRNGFFSFSMSPGSLPSEVVEVEVTPTTLIAVMILPTRQYSTL